MKKVIAISLIMFILSGCNNKQPKESPIQNNTNVSANDSIVSKNEVNQEESTEYPETEMPEEGEEANRAYFDKDGELYLHANMNQHHCMFGYERPDTTSQKMILLSLYTYDVEGNPYKCPFGAYYETSGIDGTIRIIGLNNNFYKAEIIGDNFPKNISNIIYFEEHWIEKIDNNN